MIGIGVIELRNQEHRHSVWRFFRELNQWRGGYNRQRIVQFYNTLFHMFRPELLELLIQENEHENQPPNQENEPEHQPPNRGNQQQPLRQSERVRKPVNRLNI